MNLSWLPSIFNRGKIQPVDPARNNTIFQPLGFVPIELRLSIEEQISVSMVWACIRNIVDPIASSDVNVFTVDSKGRKQLPDEALAYLLNVRPNPDLTAQAFKEILLTETVINGNGFAEIVKDKAGRVAELWPLPTDAVKVSRDASGLIYVIAQQDGETKTLTAAEIIHVRGPSVRGFLGDSVVFRAAKAVSLAVAQEQFASAYYINNTVLGGTIEIPGRMDDDTRKVLSADWKNKYGGKKKAHGVAVLEGGAKFVSFNVEADKAQLVPSRTFSVEDVARYFGVPLVRLGVQAAAQGYGTNVSQLNLQFVRDTLTPWVNRLCEEVAFKCYPLRSPWRTLEVDLQWLTLGDAMERAQAYEVLIRTGVKTVNECRAIEGDNSIGPDGDFNLVGTGLMILTEDNLAKPQPPAPFGPPGQPPTDPMEPHQDGPGTALDAFRKKINARLSDLKRAGHGPELLAEHTSQLIEKALVTLPGDPQNVRTALAAVAAGATNQQAMFSLQVP